jgi:hypothetical protein
MENIYGIKDRINYLLTFLRHSKNQKDNYIALKDENIKRNLHELSNSDLKLRSSIKNNYTKSFIIWNSIAIYINIIRKRKNFLRFFSSILFFFIFYLKLAHLIFTSISLISAFYYNERFMHIDYLLSGVNPNIIMDYTDSSSRSKDLLAIQILQAIIFEDLKQKENNR